MQSENSLLYYKYLLKLEAGKETYWCRLLPCFALSPLYTGKVQLRLVRKENSNIVLKSAILIFLYFV